MSTPAPFKHIFVATDFSPGAAEAIVRAGRLPLVSGGKISVVHVLPDQLPRMARAGAETTARQQLETAVTALSHAPTARARRPIRVSSAVFQGQAYVEIVRHARSAGADLIVLGRHGRRPVRDLFIGSTADRVIRAGDLPVLVVRRAASRNYRQPVLAVDLEDTSRSVATVALRVLGPDVKTATLVHAYQVPFEGLVTPRVSPGKMTLLRRDARQEAAAALMKLRSSLDEVGVRWRAVVVHGDPRTVILAQAALRRADLIAVGTHGRSGLSHALLGSVAERVLQAATCDVLVARPARVSFKLP